MKEKALITGIGCSQTDQTTLFRNRESKPLHTSNCTALPKQLISLCLGLFLTCVLTMGMVALSYPVLAADGVRNEALVFKGCSIIRRAFMTEAARAYEMASGQKIDVMGGGATLGIRATAAGDADIGGTCRPPLPKLSVKEKGVQSIQIAWDALVVITNPSNPVDSISLKQLKLVLQGEIVNWRELGGPDKQIVPVFRSQAPEYGGKLSGVGYMTRQILFGDLEIDFSSRALFFRHSAEVEETVEKIPYSFAVTGVSSANKRQVKVLAIDDFKPNRANIASAAYPLFRPLYLVTQGDPSPAVKGFLKWLLSDEGQQVVSDQGTVTLLEGFRLSDLFRTQNEAVQPDVDK